MSTDVLEEGSAVIFKVARNVRSSNPTQHRFNTNGGQGRPRMTYHLQLDGQSVSGLLVLAASYRFVLGLL